MRLAPAGIARSVLPALLLCAGLAPDARGQGNEPFLGCVYGFWEDWGDVATPPCRPATWEAVDAVIEEHKARDCAWEAEYGRYTCSGWTSERWCHTPWDTAAHCLREYYYIEAGNENDIYGQALVLCPQGSTIAGGEDLNMCRCRDGLPWNEATFSCGGCPAGTKWVDAANACTPIVEIDRTRKPVACEAQPAYGNPIHPLTGAKTERVDLGLRLGGLQLRLTYDTARRAGLPTGAETDLVATELPSFGELWASTLHRRVVIGASQHGARVSRGDGRIVSFVGDGQGHYTPDADIDDRLLPVSGDYHYLDDEARALESYDNLGRLQRLSRIEGRSLDFRYSDEHTPPQVAPAPGYLTQVEDYHGRAVRFEYELPQGAPPATGGRVSRIVDAAGGVIAAAYDEHGNLSRLTWQDGTSRQFLYEDDAVPWALTGIVDERDVRVSTYAYDGAGRAVATQRAGGVDSVSVTYGDPPRIIVTDEYDSIARVVYRYRTWRAPAWPAVTLPTGAIAALGVTSLLDMPRLTSRSQPAGAGCAASTTALAYDANGNIRRRDDFNGTRTCYRHDPSRNLQTARVEGLETSAGCSALLTEGAPLPSGAHKISTEWHPRWRLETRVAEPRRITTHVYNGQPDPFDGGALASCAPDAARLPDGEPIVVLCRKVEQATTDGTGALGFGAALQGGVPPRTWRATYYEYGQLLSSEDGPNSTTTYDYYDSPSEDYRPGDLRLMMNAKGQATEFPQYDAHGNALRSVDVNGVVTAYEYDARQRLVSVAVAGRITRYQYDLAGLLGRTTRPDSSHVEYSYDDAQRLTGLSDNRGNQIRYTLDDAGQVIGMEITDLAGALHRDARREMDPLGRVRLTTGRQ